MTTAIEFENIGKQYRLGLVSTGTLSHDLNRFWQTKVMRREDPYLNLGETNDRAHKGNSDYVWALKDINFKVEQGDVVGIIGRNGAGKSTLLKLLSRVTAPTTGTIRAKGRIASLLEVGTGFHPEMTGRENIYMNGAIMGMSRSEITRKLDEIVDFSGCERYLDTPVKRYSSGMTVRLGFAIAAHLEPEILVVDEVLAVGDAEFQKKAIGKMQDVSRGEGRTVLFVSHNMESIKMLCNRGVVLHNGSINMTGSAEDCVNHYINSLAIEKIVRKTIIEEKHRDNYSFLTKDIEFKEVSILNECPESIANDETLSFSVKLAHNHGSRDFQLCIFFQNVSDIRVVFCMTKTLSVPMGKKEFEVKVDIPYHSLPKGRYSVRMETNLQDFNKGSKHFDFVHHVLSFEIKYIHQEKKDEFLFWNTNFGETLQLEKIVLAEIT